MKPNRRFLSAFLLLTALLLTATLAVGCGEDTVTVRFLGEDGGEITSQTVARGGTLTVPPNPRKTGYTFSGWLLAGEIYDFTAAGATTVTEDRTFTAQFTKSTCTVAFFDGDTQISAVEVSPGARVTPPAYSKTGYTIAGWYAAGADTPFNFNAAVRGDLRLTARLVADRYTVRFFDEDGTTPLGGELAEQTLPYGEAITVPAVTRAHAILSGWRLRGAEETTDLTGATATGDAEYIAVWQYDTYTVTFFDEDGETVLFRTEVRWGELPVYGGQAPVKDVGDGREWYFVGWDKTFAPVTEDTAYTAVYRRKTLVQEPAGDTYDEDIDWGLSRV